MTQLNLFDRTPAPYVQGCQCRPGHRCDPCTRVSRASRRMFRLCRIWGDQTARRPVEHADQVTSMNDARTALCIAIGIPIHQIDPCTGHDRRRSP